MERDSEDGDKPLSSFGGRSSRDWGGESSVTFEVKEDGYDDEQYEQDVRVDDSVDFKATPVLRESIASPVLEMDDKENRRSAFGARSRLPRARDLDAVSVEVTPNGGATPGGASEQSPSFDLALPIPPIASLTPENIVDTPELDNKSEEFEDDHHQEESGGGFGDKEGAAQKEKVRDAPKESAALEGRETARASVRRSTVLSQSTDGNIFSATKERTAARDSQAMKSSTNSAPADMQQLALPPIPKGIMDRIATLGPELPNIQKWILYTGIVLDVIGKLTLVYELNRFATKKDWAWFSCVMMFFLLSGFMASTYWLAHYTYPQPSSSKPEVRIFGFSKTDVKRIIRRFGAVCAAFQLGTAFAATRALYSKDVNQRKIMMDLRGMRLVDTVFLTLSMCGLQAYIGISCTNPDSHCPGRIGFDPVLSLSIACSLVSGTLCFTSLDLMDEWKSNRDHLVEMTLFSLYRLCEVSARILTLALFAAICGLWVFMFIVLHAVAVVLMLKFTPASKKVWAKIWTSMQSLDLFKCFGFQVSVPVINDVSLLGLCLAWPPSCFVSNATDKAGRFWWRSHMEPRRAFSCLDAPNVFIPLPTFNTMMVVENVLMLTFSYVWLSGWSKAFFEAAVSMTFLWQFFALTWVSFSHNHNLENVKGDSHVVNNGGILRQSSDQLNPQTPLSVMKSPYNLYTPNKGGGNLTHRTPMKDVGNSMTLEQTPDAKAKSRLSLSRDDCEAVVPASERRLSVTSYSLNEEALRESSYFTPHPAKKLSMMSP
ncbi:hypothetical protein HOP50_04g33450 [Chloropicon primus]|uniref:Transmembrane protein n=1 Tax=Chloropicon primus TaxID=1764295 RepID=A0A5B8MLF9_9CHLO|nr:hypothetical protein A3770_04p33420 [Chloropicon primus]UPR00036.1 hypothetical protein HOP50_04g33450 [Chloropicon primus]|eukprot:QDZ20824.1 hypothetical protein A3770_04p33420 [Chloropicon primus]